MSAARRQPDRAPRLGVLSTGVAALFVLLAGVLTAILADDDDLPADGARVHLDGAAIVVRADGTTEAVEDEDVLRSGDEITITEGTALLELAAGGAMEGRAGWGGAADTRLRLGDAVSLLAGDVLATGPAGVAVEAAGTAITLGDRAGETAARIRRQLAVSVSTYEGAAAVDSAGQEREVRALRHLEVASVGRPSSGNDPLRYDPADLDPWDLRYLGGAIDLTRRLDALSRSLTAQGVTRASAADFASLLPSLADEAAFGPGLLDQRSAGETLVGAAITTHGDRDSFAARWRAVFDFRDDGATWGLVALDQQVTGVAVLEDVQQALDRSNQSLGGNLASADPGSTPSPATPSGAAPTPTTAPSSPTSTPPPTSQPTVPPTLPPPDTTEPILPPPDTTEPILPPEPDPDDDLLGTVVDPLTDLLGGLIGGG